MPSQTPASSAQDNVRRDMSISITDPTTSQTVGSSFTVQGNYSCPIGNPTFACSIAPASSAEGQTVNKLSADYVTAGTSTWEAYFSGISQGNFNVTATISHTGQSKNSSVTISVSTNPGVYVSSPQQGASIPTGTYTVTGTVDAAYVTGYQVQVSLTGNGVTDGGPVTATPDEDGNWTVDLPIDGGLSGDTDINFKVVLLPANSTIPVSEVAVGKLTVE